MNQLADCLQSGKIDQARGMARTIVNRLLKTIYAQVRGQASAAAMRSLLELEIEIGGDDGDFWDFENGQMIDLFIRGEVTGHMGNRTAPGLALAQAVDFQAIAGWLDDEAHEADPPSPASVRFVHAWLRLFAEEAGILDPDEAVAAQGLGLTESTPKKALKGPERGKPYTDPATGMRFVFVPGGTFSMGDTFDEGVEDEKPVHEVRLSDFYMAICPVTQAQWKCLMTENPSAFVGDDHPVEQVRLLDVQTFIDKLNAVSDSALLFDLPSEAQWEYAARSGGKAQLYAGDQDPEAVAWYQDDQIGGTAPVTHKAPNDLGIYDMSGNVWEWCRDIYYPQAYLNHSALDPVITEGGTDRVIRGGSWHLDAWSARCSRRFRFDPELFGPALGFRVVANKR